MDLFPAMTRRGLIGCLATAAASSSWPQPDPAAEPTAPVDEDVLSALWRQFAEALDACEAARQRFNQCERECAEAPPRPPVVLTRRGPLGHLLRKGQTWWTGRDLRILLGDTPHGATEVEARAMLSVARAYEARVRHARRKTGIADAQTAYETALDALDRLARAILAAPALSLNGVAIKARTVKLWGKPEWWSCDAEDADPYEALGAQVLDAVIAMAPRSAEK